LCPGADLKAVAKRRIHDIKYTMIIFAKICVKPTYFLEKMLIFLTLRKNALMLGLFKEDSCVIVR